MKMEHTLNRWGIVEQDGHYQLKINKTEYKAVVAMMKAFGDEGGTWTTSASQKAADEAVNRITGKCLLLLHVIRFKHKFTKGFLQKEFDIIESTHQTQSQMKTLLVEAGLLDASKEFNGGEFKSSRFFLNTGNVENWYSVSKEILDSAISQVVKWEKNYLNKYSRLEGIRFEDGYDAISHGEMLINSKNYTEDEKKLKSVATENIVNGDWSSSFKKYRAEQRLYCPVNQVPSEQVCHLVDVNGLKMVEVDIKASHPRILSHVLVEMATTVLNKNNFTKFYTDLLGDEKNVQLDQYLARLVIESKVLKNICDGDLYHSISSMMLVSRDQAKKEFMFFINNYHADIKNVENYYNFFMAKVPLLTRFIRKMHSIERINKNLGRFEPKYYIHQQLSRYESSIVLDVCKDFVAEHRSSTDFNIAPRHDSIVVTKKYAKKIEEKLILKGLTKNVLIILDVEDYSIESKDPEYMKQNLTRLESRQVSTQEENLPLSISYGRNEPLSAQSSGTEPEVPVQSSGTEPEVPVQSSRTTGWKVERASKVTVLTDGRYRCSVKDVKYNSRKGETLEEFRQRMIDAGAILL